MLFSPTRSLAGRFVTRSLVLLVLLLAFFHVPAARGETPSEPPEHIIVIRTTENVTNGRWEWILEQSKALGVTRIDVLVKQDEDNFNSRVTGRTLQSGEMLVALPGETTAEGWENSDWLVQMLARAKELDIEIWAWWPVFHDAQTGALYPDAQYSAGDGSIFVDASVSGVQRRQEELLRKLLQTYEFDGISLDWLRYDNWMDGTQGPLAERFHAITGKRPNKETMQTPAERAIWGNLRETAIAEWVGTLIEDMRPVRPGLKWGAYLLPPQFKEVSQNYRYLTQAGLTHIQPMIYWDLWGHPAEWSGEVVSKYPFWRQPDTQLMPTLDLNRPETEFLISYRSMGEGAVAGILWYLDTDWQPVHFKKIRRIQNRWREAELRPAATPADILPGPSLAMPVSGQIAPAQFHPDAGAWTLVLLSELHNQGALSAVDPVVPVLALHRFVAGEGGAEQPLWTNSEAYIDRFLDFLAAHDFSVIPLSRLQAHMMSDYASDMPAKPVVLTVDDGAHSVLEYFHPRAVERGLPYTLSVISGPRGTGGGYLDEDNKADRQMRWDEIERIAASGLVEIVSHTHEMHSYVGQGPGHTLRAPAALARRWLDDEARQETDGERYRRVVADLTTSRRELMDRLSRPVSILTWPYGAYSRDTERAAREAGFTHFLEFGGSRLAHPAWEPARIFRLPLTKGDEGVALEMPRDHLTAQRWWLAFLGYARDTASASLIEATLLQLDAERAGHPEAELSRAALDLLRGRPQTAALRIERLQAAYADDRAIGDAIANFQLVHRQVQ